MDLRTSQLVRPVIPGSRNITSWSSHILSPRLIPWTASFHLLNFIPIYDKKNYKFVATDKTDYLSDCQTLHLHHTLEERGENYMKILIPGAQTEDGNTFSLSPISPEQISLLGILED